MSTYRDSFTWNSCLPASCIVVFGVSADTGRHTASFCTDISNLRVLCRQVVRSHLTQCEHVLRSCTGDVCLPGSCIVLHEVLGRCVTQPEICQDVRQCLDLHSLNHSLNDLLTYSVVSPLTYTSSFSDYPTHLVTHTLAYIPAH